MGTLPLISIGIVSLDNPNYLELLLRGLKRNTINTYEVLVHGNKASAAFRSVVNNHKEITHYQESRRNRYLAAPYNELFSHATGQYYFRLDDDMYPPPQWDQVLLQKVDSQNIYRLISPALYVPGGPKAPFNIYSFGVSPQNFEEDRFNKEYLIHRTFTKDMPFVYGVLFMPKLLWETMGGYNERFARKCDLEFPNHVWAKAKEKIDPVCAADAPFYHFTHVGNDKAGFASPDSNVGPLLTEVFGEDVLNGLRTFIRKLRAEAE